MQLYRQDMWLLAIFYVFVVFVTLHRALEIEASGLGSLDLTQPDYYARASTTPADSPFEQHHYSVLCPATTWPPQLQAVLANHMDGFRHAVAAGRLSSYLHSLTNLPLLLLHYPLCRRNVSFISGVGLNLIALLVIARLAAWRRWQPHQRSTAEVMCHRISFAAQAVMASLYFYLAASCSAHLGQAWQQQQQQHQAGSSSSCSSSSSSSSEAGSVPWPLCFFPPYLPGTVMEMVQVVRRLLRRESVISLVSWSLISLPAHMHCVCSLAFWASLVVGDQLCKVMTG